MHLNVKNSLNLKACPSVQQEQTAHQIVICEGGFDEVQQGS
jgi:hypothetical protein